MSSFTINDSITLTSSASIDNIRISGNTISSTNTGGHIVLAPNGNGNVGIGATSPGTKLHITNTTNTSLNLVTLENVAVSNVLGTTKMIVMNNLRNYNSYNQESLTNTCGTDIITVNGDNDVRYSGFTLTELSKLRVEYDYPANSGNYTSSSFCIYTNGGSGNTEKIRVTGAGNVGIGTTSPTSRLTINSGSTSNAYAEDNYHGFAVTTGTNYQTIWMGYDGSADIGYINCAKSGSVMPICLQTRGGNVGIGTTNPAAKLDVAGTIRHQGLTLNEGTTPNVDEIKTFTKTLSVSTSWIDTGIIGSDLETGSYIIQVFSHNGPLGQYHSTFTGFMSWYNTVTNSNYYNEVLLHSVGNDITNVLYIRTQLLLGNTNTLKLQIRLSGGSGSGNFTFKFRRMI